MHTPLRLPTGIFYAHGVKANVLFFDREPASEKPNQNGATATRSPRMFSLQNQRTNEIFPATIRNRQPNTLTLRKSINARTNR